MKSILLRHLLLRLLRNQNQVHDQHLPSHHRHDPPQVELLVRPLVHLELVQPLVGEREVM